MAIKPVDFQVMIPRTMDAAKMSSDMSQKNAALLQQQTQSTLNKAESSLKQVYSREQAQGVRISEKQRENKKNDGKNKQSDSSGKEENEQENGRNLIDRGKITSTIDIKI